MQINYWYYVAEIVKLEDANIWRWCVRRKDAEEILAWGEKRTQEAAISCAAEHLDLLCSRSA